jgi:hypothetical protein
MAEQNATRSRRIDSLYTGKSTAFKIFLLGGVVVLSAVFIWYTFSVIDQLKANTKAQVEKYVRMWQLAANSNMTGSELQFIFDEVIVKANFPIISQCRGSSSGRHHAKDAGLSEEGSRRNG